jgi:putative CocE/NonD family hydrolase
MNVVDEARMMKSIVARFLTSLALGVIAVAAPGLVQPALAQTPGPARTSSLYVTVEDGTRIAIDVSLPANLRAEQRVPALIKGTPYWRARKLTQLGEAKAPELATEPDVATLNERGYAVVTVDARGTGASFGTINILFGDKEISDYGAVADWITGQRWSDGKVGAYGFSYRGMTAANIASLPKAAIKAVAPLFDLSDLYLLIYPGGAFENYLVSAWGAQTRELNNGKIPCNSDPVCEQMIRGPKPVDADPGEVLLGRAIAEHAANFNVYDCLRAAPARDDRICASGQSLSDVSVIARKAKIEQQHLPMFVLTGWLDESSPQQALFRYRTFSNEQTLIIGPFTHGGFMSDDPFFPDHAPVLTYKEQTEQMADFFDRYLKNEVIRPSTKSIRYYVNGAAAWRTSPVWPPVGTTTQNWYLRAASVLADSAPRGTAGADHYKVDFSASTGELSGYRGQVDLSKTDYGNRASADSHLLVYTSAPLRTDMEIAGDPVAHIKLASSATDGLLIIYLEDVAPDGRVTYVSQGDLRLAFRKLVRGDDSAYSADPFHSYRRSDMAPLTPGTLADIVIAISPIAALIRKDHRLRVAIAGADAGNLERIPALGDADLTIVRGAESYVEVPHARQ